MDIDVETVFADATLCDAADACREAYGAAIKAAEDQSTCRVLTRISRLELLELLANDFVEIMPDLPPETPDVLRAALGALHAALTSVPELERAYCASAVAAAAAAAAAPSDDSWTLTFLEAWNGPVRPVPCEGAVMVLFCPLLPQPSIDAVLRNLMPRLAAAAGQPLTAIRMPPYDRNEDDYDPREDCVSVVSPEGRTLLQVVAFDDWPLFAGPEKLGREQEFMHEFEIIIHPAAAATAAAVCEAARASIPVRQFGEVRAGWNELCHVAPHGTIWCDVPWPGVQPARPRLTMRAITGTKEGTAAGTSATRFDLFAEAVPEPVLASAPAKTSPGAALSGKERIGRALLTYSNLEQGLRGPTLELFEVKRRWRRLGVGTALLCAVERHVVRATSPPPVDIKAPLLLCDAAMARPFFEAMHFDWLNDQRTDGMKWLFSSPLELRKQVD